MRRSTVAGRWTRGPQQHHAGQGRERLVAGKDGHLDGIDALKQQHDGGEDAARDEAWPIEHQRQFGAQSATTSATIRDDTVASSRLPPRNLPTRSGWRLRIWAVYFVAVTPRPSPPSWREERARRDNHPNFPVALSPQHCASATPTTSPADIGDADRDARPEHRSRQDDRAASPLARSRARHPRTVSYICGGKHPLGQRLQHHERLSMRHMWLDGPARFWYGRAVRMAHESPKQVDDNVTTSREMTYQRTGRGDRPPHDEDTIATCRVSIAHSSVIGCVF